MLTSSPELTIPETEARRLLSPETEWVGGGTPVLPARDLYLGQKLYVPLRLQSLLPT